MARRLRAVPLSRRRARVVVVGGGFAGASCALALRRLNADIDVALIDPADRYVTCPMSNEVLIGERGMDSITIARSGLERAGVHPHRDRVVAVDAQHRSVSLAGGAVLDYDRLVVAPGIRFLWNTPEGYDEAAAQRMPHAWQAGMQTRLLGDQLRRMDDGGVVAISVPGGLMRCPPGPYERASLMADYLKRHKPRSKLLIFDANNHFPRQEEFTNAWHELYPGMIEWISPLAGGKLERVDAATSTLYTSRGAQRVEVANIIPPQAPGQIALDAGLAAGHGWCPVDAVTFESTKVPGIHVIGDACIAGAMPKSASAAHSQALQCATAIVATLHEKPVPAGMFDSVCYSMLGRGRALSIHGHFHIVDGAIEALEASPSDRPATSAQEAQRAQSWYRNLIRESFGA